MPSAEEKPPDPVRAVRAHAAARPGQLAVKDSGRSLSYAALSSRITALVTGLARHGVRRGDRVGVHLENSADYVAVVFACLAAGAIFVPIPCTDPDDRIRRIARDCAVRLTVVREREKFSAGAAGDLRPVPVAELAGVPVPAGGLASRPGPGGPAASDGDIVYLVYTSGSTGDPKGVAIRRESLRNFVRNTVGIFGFDTQTRALAVSPFHFDGAFGSLFSVLQAGGSLVVAPHGPLLPGDFFRLLVSEGITHTTFSPTLLRLLVSSRDLPLLGESRLATVGLGGEDCLPEQIAPLFRYRPRLRVFNRYGPTETTVVVASYLITPEFCESGQKIPLGMPDPGVGFHLVDAGGHLVTGSGVAGELCVEGVQVMAGYWGAPEVTAAVLRGDLVPGRLVYRTGDLAARNGDGLYVYLDRADNVVKRAGNRVSMTELTAAMLAIPGVREAVSVVDREAGRSVIRAYAVAGTPMSAADVRAELLLRVPGYMNPDTLDVLAELPRLSNGKPDVRRLRAARERR